MPRLQPSGLIAFIAIAVGIATSAQAAFDVPVDDATLADNYGKFLAPNGVDLAMTVQSDTAINGRLVLRSVFTVDQGPGTLQLYAPPVGSNGPSVTLTSGAGKASTAPPANQGVAVSVDRATGTTIIQPTSVPSTPAVSVGSGSSSSTAGNAGLTAVSVTPGGGGVDTGSGVISVNPAVNGARVTLDGAGFSISHLVGAATGTVVANTVNNRTIDTITNVQIDVRNAQAMAAGTAMLRVDQMVTAATRAMVR